MTTFPQVSPLPRAAATLRALRIPNALLRVIERVSGFAAVLAFFIIVTIAIFWPWAAHLHSALVGPPEDNMNDFWNTWYAVSGKDQSHFFATRLLRFPEGTSLIYQSFAYPQVFAVWALSRFFGADLGTLVALQNLTLLASFPLAGVAAFYLVRHLTHSALGSLIGGFAFAFNPAHVAQALHHAGVSSIEFLPLFVLAYLLALDRQSKVWIAVAVVCLALGALSSWYYLFYGIYFLGFHILYERVRDHAWPRGWHVVAPAVCVLSTVVVLSPLIIPMVIAVRPSVYMPGGNIYVADVLAYVTFPPAHLLFGLTRGLYLRFTGDPWEATVYLGLVNLVVLGWGCLRTGVGRNSLMFYVVFGMLVFCILACGETLHVAGISTHVPLPDTALDKLPFFANVRTPARAIVFVYLFMSIGIGAAAAAILQPRRWTSTASILAVAALIAMDFYPTNLAATPVACAEGLSVLKADTERNFGVLNLPIGHIEENAYMLDQVCHRRPIVGGITTREMGTSLIYRLSLADLGKQREQLVQSHVKYILLHLSHDGLYNWNKELAPVAQFLMTYRTVYAGSDLVVLKVY